MGFHNVESILANIENKDKSKLLEIEQNIIKGLDEIRKIFDKALLLRLSKI